MVCIKSATHIKNCVQILLQVSQVEYCGFVWLRHILEICVALWPQSRSFVSLFFLNMLSQWDSLFRRCYEKILELPIMISSRSKGDALRCVGNLNTTWKGFLAKDVSSFPESIRQSANQLKNNQAWSGGVLLLWKRGTMSTQKLLRFRVEKCRKHEFVETALFRWCPLHCVWHSCLTEIVPH